MIQLVTATPYIIGAIILVTLVDTAGAAASRIFKFNYTNLSFISFGTYILIGYIVSPKCGLNVSILSSLIVAFYDSTVGWKLSKLCKPNINISEDEMKKMTQSLSLTIMLVVAPVLALTGYWLS